MLTIKPGTYRLVNLQSHTALDLSEGDGRTLIGWTQHNNTNQHFIFTPLGHGGGYLIQNAWNGNYATVEDGIHTGVSVVGSGFPATWVLEEITHAMHGIAENTEAQCFRIRWPNTRYVFDLEGYGCDKDGTRIQLAYEQNPVHPCQVWQFKKMPSVPPLTQDVSREATGISSDTESSSEVSWGRYEDIDDDDEPEDDSDDEYLDASEDGLDIVLVQSSQEAVEGVKDDKKNSAWVVENVEDKNLESCRPSFKRTWTRSTTTITTAHAATRKSRLEKVL